MDIVVKLNESVQVSYQNNYIENIQRDWWEYLDQKYSKRLVGIPKLKIFKENTTKLSSLNV